MGPAEGGNQAGNDDWRYVSKPRKSAELEIPSSVSKVAFRSSSPLGAILVRPRDGYLMKIHQTPWTGRLGVNFGCRCRASVIFPGFPRIVRNRLTVKSTSARTIGMPMYDPIS